MRRSDFPGMGEIAFDPRLNPRSLWENTSDIIPQNDPLGVVDIISEYVGTWYEIIDLPETEEDVD